MVAPYFHRMYDLAIKGGEVVTPEFRRGLNVYITGEKIAAVTSDDRPSRESVDASGLLVMPGMVDAHVHFMDPGDSRAAKTSQLAQRPPFVPGLPPSSSTHTQRQSLVQRI